MSTSTSTSTTTSTGATLTTLLTSGITCPVCPTEGDYHFYLTALGILSIMFIIVSAALIFFMVCWCCHRRRNKKNARQYRNSSGGGGQVKLDGEDFELDDGDDDMDNITVTVLGKNKRPNDIIL